MRLSGDNVEKSWLRTKNSVHRCVHLQATLKCQFEEFPKHTVKVK